jgi:hypothetical protein
LQTWVRQGNCTPYGLFRRHTDFDAKPGHASAPKPEFVQLSTDRFVPAASDMEIVDTERLDMKILAESVKWTRGMLVPSRLCQTAKRCLLAVGMGLCCSVDMHGAAPTAEAVSAAAVDPVSRQLQNIVLQAIDSLDPSRLPNLEKAKQQLSGAVDRLENYLNPGIANGQAWSDFLKLETLKQELQSERPNLATLVDLELNMRQNYVGLEYAPYREVQQGLANMIRAIRYGGAPEQTVEQMELKLRQLLQTLEEPVTGAATDRSFAVGLITNYLHEMNQAPAALAQIQQQFAQPNIQAFADEQFINRLLMRPVAEPNRVNECLLGTRVVGNACLNGLVSADLLPMVGGVSLQLNLNGSVSTTSNGYNRGVVFGTSAFSPVHASKTIFVSQNGISSSPANVATNLQTSIHSIDHRLRIVRKIAGRKAAEQKPLADSIAQGRLQNRIRSQYELQVEQQLATARVRLAGVQNQTPPELTRLGIPLPSYSYHSDNLAVYGQVKQAAPFQLAAHQACTIPRPVDSHMIVEAHQSALVNALDLVLGDRTIRSADLDDYARQATGKVPEEVQREADGEPWSITLATFRPVEIELDDSTVKIKLRITRMTRGSQALDDGAFITAAYTPKYEQGVLTLTRIADVDISFARAARGVRVVTLRSFLKGKFDLFFKEQIATERLDVPSRFPNLPKLDLSVLTIDDGWLQLGWH